MRAPGIGSGLPITDWVNMMVKAEATPKMKQFQSQNTKLETQLSSYGQLKSSLSEFKDMLEKMQKDEAFEKRSVTINGKDQPFSATADKNAISGNFDISVQQLASEQKTTLKGVSADTKFSGTLDFSVGKDGSETFSVDIKEGSSLKDVADAINKSPDNKGVKATILAGDDGTSRLVLVGQDTGEENKFTVSGAGSTELTDMLGGQSTQAAKDAEFTVDGQKMTSSTNKVKNAIQGITLELTDVSEKVGDAYKTNRITIDYDRDGVKDSLKKFVDAYNKVIDVTTELTKYNKETKKAAPLTGDSLTRTLNTEMRGILTAPDENNKDIKFLADLGITSDRDGKLQIDDKKLDEALEKHFTQAGDMFGGKDGIIGKMESLMKGYVGTGGTLTEKDKTLQEQKSKLDTQISAFEKHMKEYEARVTAQFSALDQSIAQMNQQMSTLMSSLA
ncbi:flagellar filament capping protein FliD [Plesiomonas shigelloides]|uniref:flagellar filament capping protein FliD n=1 Tax=Plesiomonas shigelloides TaxID=703 RepID=UPI00126201C0|nr:flagellar filament capping protein FliD [Plesiomonas shigelloides]KAB7660843.1 flagellar filament capping protein FliD [Plesiomonas shigelloides]